MTRPNERGSAREERSVRFFQNFTFKLFNLKMIEWVLSSSIFILSCLKLQTKTKKCFDLYVNVIFILTCIFFHFTRPPKISSFFPLTSILPCSPTFFHIYAAIIIIITNVRTKKQNKDKKQLLLLSPVQKAATAIFRELKHLFSYFPDMCRGYVHRYHHQCARVD